MISKTRYHATVEKTVELQKFRFLGQRKADPPSSYCEYFNASRMGETRECGDFTDELLRAHGHVIVLQMNWETRNAQRLIGAKLSAMLRAFTLAVNF